MTLVEKLALASVSKPRDIARVLLGFQPASPGFETVASATSSTTGGPEPPGPSPRHRVSRRLLAQPPQPPEDRNHRVPAPRHRVSRRLLAQPPQPPEDRN